MNKAYLDNNIFVSIEAGDYFISQFLNKNNYTYYFSEAHMEELLEARNNPKVSQSERLNLISKLCDRNHILPNVHNTPEFFEKDPIEMYNIVKHSLGLITNQIVNQFDEPSIKFRRELGFDTVKFNNEAPETILSLIDTRMKKCIGIDLTTYLRATGVNMGQSIYHTLIQLIDMANYWGDKKTNHSNVARLYDAAHAYFAQICDVLITNDKKMIMKVRAVYSFLGVKTKVMTAEEFLYN